MAYSHCFNIHRTNTKSFAVNVMMAEQNSSMWPLIRSNNIDTRVFKKV